MSEFPWGPFQETLSTLTTDQRLRVLRDFEPAADTVDVWGPKDGTLLEVSVNRYHLLLTTHTYMEYLGGRTSSSNHQGHRRLSVRFFLSSLHIHSWWKMLFWGWWTNNKDLQYHQTQKFSKPLGEDKQESACNETVLFCS